ncbi:FkbM family methyltransferase [Thalassovita taeanensis]|uniref:Methyltransferase, FkbM family n=1 Tax=Thalassovita taeanensis TaxID=657014 RepID=A0A1H9F9P9_9RHOB|nr:FkbM family methyltransferase [Thalassovita taeanensis]SEQ34680.1 methyltransferase, FkbM family [Thalassovita taeanensis]
MAKFVLEDIALEIPDSLLNEKLVQKLNSGQYEFAEARAAKMRVKPGHRVLELGGGIGYISSICAQLTDPSKIVTVEANPFTIKVIRKNLDSNRAVETRLEYGAVAGDCDAGETVTFRVGKAFWGSSVAGIEDRPGELVEVPLISLISLFEAHRPDVVIMDIEGSEMYLFDRPWPRFVRQVIMELHPRAYSMGMIKKIVDCMSQSGLTYDPGPSRGTLIGFRRVPSKKS